MENYTARQPNVNDIIAGDILKRVRNVRGITQETLAKNIGITFQQVQKYEKGKNRISISRLFEICKCLQVSPESFVFAIDMICSHKTNKKRMESADSIISIITNPDSRFTVELGE